MPVAPWTAMIFAMIAIDEADYRRFKKVGFKWAMRVPEKRKREISSNPPVPRPHLLLLSDHRGVSAFALNPMRDFNMVRGAVYRLKINARNAKRRSDKRNHIVLQCRSSMDQRTERPDKSTHNECGGATERKYRKGSRPRGRRYHREVGETTKDRFRAGIKTLKQKRTNFLAYLDRNELGGGGNLQLGVYHADWDGGPPYQVSRIVSTKLKKKNESIRPRPTLKRIVWSAN